MKLLRNLLFKILYRIGVGHYLLFKNRRKGRVPVLVFHKIIPEYDGIWPGIHPKLFEEMILLIKQHYTVLPLHYLHSQPNTDFSKTCFITFDDGYKDYLDYAYPILKRNQIHSTVFVLPHNLSNHGHIWTSTIIFFVKHYWFSEIRDFFISHNQHVYFADKFDDFTLNLAITRHLCKLKHLERQVIIDSLQNKFKGDNRIIEKELLSFEELRKLDPVFSSVASHSLSHPSFKLEEDTLFIENEMSESKSSIEKELNVNVSAFAFPFAQYNESSMTLAKKYYKLCFTRINDFVDLHRLKKDANYIYDLPRFNIHQDSSEEVFLLINGFHKRVKN
jgi:peptidoglycan/xylan/chitin deacetylase (PgdA/CDA1 family)